jgi:hypothetical protein
VLLEPTYDDYDDEEEDVDMRFALSHDHVILINCIICVIIMLHFTKSSTKVEDEASP